MNAARTILAIVSLALLISCSGIANGPNGGSNPPSPAEDSISGTVTLNCAPLAGATVTDFMTNTSTVFRTTATDANGKYTFSGMSVTGNVPGDYQIYVNQNGYGFYPSVASGATVKRADYTGQFLSTGGLAPSGIFFNVIDFVALPDSSVTGANFAAYDGTNPPVTLPATGQQISYVAGDDASVKKGVAWSAATRFTDNQDGTITDTLTGLIWLKDAGCLGSALWSDRLTVVNQLASGACGLTDGSADGDWRMPNLTELESLIDVPASSPALPTNHPFLNVSGGIYWTSTSYYGGVGGSDKAWTIRFSDGRYMNDTASNVKLTSMNVIWTVKGTGGGAIKLQATGFHVPYAAGDDSTVQAGVPLIFPRFIDHGDGTIIDTMTGLVWLKQADCIRGSWSDALTAVNSLAGGQCGLSDGSTAGQWRMPNRNELLSLSDRAQTNMAQYLDYTYRNKDGSVSQGPIFTNYIEAKYYWTSTTDATDPSEAWTVYSCDFGVYDIAKTAIGYTLAVR
jgi:hypothetical protein